MWKEEVFQDSMRLGLRVNRSLFASQSDFQHVEVVETQLFGRALMLDGLWMCAEADEATYHEFLVHPALTTCPSPRRVLVIGGGDGGTIREVLKHPEVEQVTMVEIDPVVVNACKQYMPKLGAEAWSDPRLILLHEDGAAFVEHAPEHAYDVILIDGSDPVGPAEVLFSKPFFEACSRALSPQGVFAAQAESPRVHMDVHLATIGLMKQLFVEVHPYYGTVSLYPSGAWSWIYASHSVSPKQVIAERVANVSQSTEIYNLSMHHGAFAIPNHIARQLNG